MAASRVARVIGPLALTAALFWWHGVYFLPFVLLGPYLRESAVVWAYVLAGSVAWARRPGNRTGPLMIALGIAWAVPYLPAPPALAPVWHSLSVALAALPIALLTHLVLSFPDGELQGCAERAVVAAAYLFGAVIPLLSVATCEAASLSPRCNFTPNALTVLPAFRASHVLGYTASIGSALTLLAVVVLVGQRWRHSTTPARRALTPVWLSTIVLLATGADVATRTWRALDFTDWGLRYTRVAGSSELLSLRATGHVLVPMAFLVGLLRLRMYRVTAARLARRLQGSREDRDLDAELARALGDPNARVAYWLPAEDRYVDVHGRPVELHDAAAKRQATPLEHDGRMLGVLLHDRMLDQGLVDDVTAVAGLAVQNERLTADVRSQLVELREAQGRIVEAADAARRKLERDLHDGAQQRLVTLGLQMREAQLRLGSADPAVRESFDGLVRDLGTALDELRELARGIHPAVLASDGLGPALRERIRHAAVPVTLGAVPDRRYSPALEATVYFVVLEALTNAAKHAQATHVAVTVREGDGWLEATVSDDGVGDARITPGSGLQGLADRVGALGGVLQVSSAQGAGTTVLARLPVTAQGYRPRDA